jgi:hypothetical protein
MYRMYGYHPLAHRIKRDLGNAWQGLLQLGTEDSPPCRSGQKCPFCGVSQHNLFTIIKFQHRIIAKRANHQQQLIFLSLTAQNAISTHQPGHRHQVLR